MKLKKCLTLLVIVALALSLLGGCGAKDSQAASSDNASSVTAEQAAYDIALGLIEEGDYSAAYDKLLECYGYEDSAKLLTKFRIIQDKMIETVYDKDGNIEGKSEVEYDEYGAVILGLQYNEDGTSWQTVKYDYEYDENGKWTACISYDEKGEIFERMEYEYNELGKEILCVHYDKNGSIRREDKTEYEYDENGKIKGRIHYTISQDSTMKTEFRYDEYGSIILNAVYNTDGTVIVEYKYAYEYDEFGRRTLETMYDENSTVSRKYGYEYDKFSRVSTGTQYDADGNIDGRIEFERDKYGKSVIETKYDNDGNILSKHEIEYVNQKVLYEGK